MTTKAKAVRSERRLRLLALIGAVVIVAGFIGVVLFITEKGQTTEEAYAVPNSGELQVPSAATESAGIPVGQDGSVGSASPEGVIDVHVYEDMMCPACGLFQEVNGDELIAMRSEGLIEVHYHPIAILDRASQGTRYSTRATNALFTVAEHDGEHFEAFFHALLENQPEEGTRGLSNGEIADIAREAGVSEDAIDRIGEGLFTQYVAEATEQSSIDGITGTPTVRIGEQDPGNGWSRPGWLREQIEDLIQFRDAMEEADDAR